MNTVSTSITLRKATLEYAKNIAKKKQISVSRFIDDIIYRMREKDVEPYPISELDKISKQMEDEEKRGTIKTYKTVKDMLVDLKS